MSVSLEAGVEALFKQRFEVEYLRAVWAADELLVGRVPVATLYHLG